VLGTANNQLLTVAKLLALVPAQAMARVLVLRLLAWVLVWVLGLAQEMA